MSKQILQSLFDRSLNHIRKQGGPSLKARGSSACVYRNDNGDGCAAAPFLTKYDPVIEGKGFIQLAQNFPELVDPVAGEHRNFVAALQVAHDASAGLDFMRKYELHMAEIAEQNGLTYTPPNEAATT